MRRSVGLDAGSVDDDVDDNRMGAEELYRAHAPFVVKFLYRQGARVQELDDLVQQVFLVAHHRGGYARGPAQPTTWLATIAVRVLATHRRTARRRQWNAIGPDQSVLEEVAGEGVDAHRHAEARESLERVGWALDKLSEDQRLVFVLHEIEERSCESLSRELNLPLGTVHSRLHAARRAFIEAHQRDAMSSKPSGIGAKPRKA